MSEYTTACLHVLQCFAMFIKGEAVFVIQWSRCNVSWNGSGPDGPIMLLLGATKIWCLVMYAMLPLLLSTGESDWTKQGVICGGLANNAT